MTLKKSILKLLFCGLAVSMFLPSCARPKRYVSAEEALLGGKSGPSSVFMIQVDDTCATCVGNGIWGQRRDAHSSSSFVTDGRGGYKTAVLEIVNDGKTSLYVVKNFDMGTPSILFATVQDMNAKEAALLLRNHVAVCNSVITDVTKAGIGEGGGISLDQGDFKGSMVVIAGAKNVGVKPNRLFRFLQKYIP